MMSSATPPQSEKPFHYTYLKEFRVSQCPLFLQHKCTQHRPFTCFHWHFSNQRRRRPLRKRDGTFTYSSDAYCSKYDETTGVCPEGDDCPYVHRNTGDTERRYHLRYYKTGTCIHETDSRGHCVKNGPHCAFAHGAQDLRPPVYDIREQQSLDLSLNNFSLNLSDQSWQDTVNLSEKIINEDQRWQDANYVLANYKTDLCKRPPRLCRQGYACPQYHNTKDRRRNPKKYKYRSSPCPTVKQGDDWKDPSTCDKGDNCQYCHTRTEQQFHPEIYKSTKCHDMVQSGYCPRSLFCAFAHVEQEIRVVEDAAQAAMGSLTDSFECGESVSHSKTLSFEQNASSISNNHSWLGFDSSIQDNSNKMSKSLPACTSPLSKSMFGSIGSSKDFAVSAAYSKAPGSERNSVSDQTALGGSYGFSNVGLNVAWSGNSASQTCNNVENVPSPTSSPPFNFQKYSNSLNSDAIPFYPSDETVNSVIGNALNDLGDVAGQGNGGDEQTARMRIRTTSSSHDSNMGSSLFPMSDPVNIPQDRMIHSMRYSGVTPDQSSISPPLIMNSMEFSKTDSLPRTRFSSLPKSQSHLESGLSGSLGNGVVSIIELEKMQEKCRQWEDSWNQAKAACDAWKLEATGANERARLSTEKNKMVAEKCRFLASKLSVDESVGKNSNCAFMHQHYELDELKKFPVTTLKQLQMKYKNDLEIVEKLIWELLWNPQS